MATANDTPVAPHGATARRALLGGAAAVGAAIAGVSRARAAPAATGADAELVALCAAWRLALAREMAVTDRLSQVLERDWSDADRVLWDESQDAVHGLERRVFGSKATTLAGVQAKAGVLGHLAAVAGIPSEPEQAASLVADVLALGCAA